MNEHVKKRPDIYIELQMLIRHIYSALFAMPKKDRVMLGDRIFSAAVDALVYYRLAYRFMEDREENKRRFSVEYEKLKELLRMAATLKKIPIEKHVALFSYIERIDSGYSRWDKATKKRIIQASGESNYDPASDNSKSRGGDGFI